MNIDLTSSPPSQSDIDSEVDTLNQEIASNRRSCTKFFITTITLLFLNVIAIFFTYINIQISHLIIVFWCIAVVLFFLWIKKMLDEFINCDRYTSSQIHNLNPVSDKDHNWILDQYQLDEVLTAYIGKTLSMQRSFIKAEKIAIWRYAAELRREADRQETVMKEQEIADALSQIQSARHSEMTTSSSLFRPGRRRVFLD